MNRRDFLGAAATAPVVASALASRAWHDGGFVRGEMLIGEAVQGDAILTSAAPSYAGPAAVVPPGVARKLQQHAFNVAADSVAAQVDADLAIIHGEA